MVSAREMRGYALHARDGAVGRVHGLYFEEEGWGVEYLVAVAGTFLHNRQVLVGVDHLLGVDRAKGVVRVDLARDEVRDNPGVFDALFRTEGPGAGYRGGPASTRPRGLPEDAGPAGSERPPRPRSSEEVAGYRVRASDGEAGRVEDLLVDEEAWRVRHVVVGMRGRHAAGEVLLDPWWIGRIAAEARTVHVGLTGGQIWGTRRYAGYEVRDPRGVRIGTAREMSADGDAEPGYVRVEVGFRRGFLRPRTVVIPTQMVAVDGTRRTLTLQ